MQTKLSSLQVTLLQRLAELEPRWTLVGGAALAGFHLGHRETRDLDLFWRGHSHLAMLPQQARALVCAAGLRFDTLQTTPSFVRARVSGEEQTVIVDLVANPSLALDADERHCLGSVELLVASRHAILVDKLCALLGRMELRDLIDVAALLASGGELERALRDAPLEDGGFSALTLAWLLRSFEPQQLAPGAGIDAETAEQLTHFRDQLIERLDSFSRSQL